MSLKKLYQSILIPQDIPHANSNLKITETQQNIIENSTSSSYQTKNQQNVQKMEKQPILTNYWPISQKIDEKSNQSPFQMNLSQKQRKKDNFSRKSQKLGNLNLSEKLIELQLKWIQKQLEISEYIRQLKNVIQQKQHRIQMLLHQNLELIQKNKTLEKQNTIKTQLFNQINQNLKDLSKIQQSQSSRAGNEENNLENLQNSKNFAYSNSIKPVSVNLSERNKELEKSYSPVCLHRNQNKTNLAEYKILKNMMKLLEQHIPASFSHNNQKFSRNGFQNHIEIQNLNNFEKSKKSFKKKQSIKKTNQQVDESKKMSLDAQKSNLINNNIFSPLKIVSVSPIIKDSANIIDQSQQHSRNMTENDNYLPFNSKISTEKSFDEFVNEEKFKNTIYQSAKIIKTHSNYPEVDQNMVTKIVSPLKQQKSKKMMENYEEQKMKQQTKQIVKETKQNEKIVKDKAQKDMKISSIYQINLKNSNELIEKNFYILKDNVYSIHCGSSEESNEKISKKKTCFKKNFADINAPTQSDIMQVSNGDYSLSSSLVSDEDYLSKICNQNVRHSSIIKCDNNEQSLKQKNLTQQRFSMNTAENCMIKRVINENIKIIPAQTQMKKNSNALQANLTNQYHSKHLTEVSTTVNDKKMNNSTTQVKKGNFLSISNEDRLNLILGAKKQLFVKSKNPEMKGSQMFQTDNTSSSDKHFFFITEENQLNKINKNKCPDAQNVHANSQSQKSVRGSYSKCDKMIAECENIDRLSFQNDMLKSYNNVLDLNSKVGSKTGKLAEKFKAQNNAVMKRFIK